MKLAAILNEINIQKGYLTADTDPQLVNGSISQQEIGRVNALAIAKRQAKERIEQLRGEYDLAVYRSAAVILVTGDAKKRKAFLDAALSDDALCVEGDSLYNGITAAAEARMSMARAMTTNVSFEIENLLAEAIGKLSPRHFLQYPRLPSQYVDAILKTTEEVLDVVKKTAKLCTEVPLSITWMERNVAAMAYNQNFSEEPLAVVVSLSDPEELPAWQTYFLSGSPRVVINANKGDVKKQVADAKAGLQAALGTQS